MSQHTAAHTAAQHATESAAAMAAKAGPGVTVSIATVAAKAGPGVTVSIATVAGYNVSEILLWATLIYTVLMIGHKLYAIWQDVRGTRRQERAE